MLLLQLRRSNRARARSKAARLPAAPAGTLSVITRQYHMLPKIPTGVAGTFADGQQMFSGVAALGESQLWQRSPPIVTTTVLATTAIMSFIGNGRLLITLVRVFFFTFAARHSHFSPKCVNLRS
jgi:hypothetical protein